MSADGVTLRADTGAVYVTGANFQGDLLVLDTNSWPEYAAVTTAYDCGKLCRQNAQVRLMCMSHAYRNLACWQIYQRCNVRGESFW